MPTYTVTVPGKGRFTVSNPAELTEEQVLSAVSAELEAETFLPESVERFFGEHPGIAQATALGTRIVAPVATGALGLAAAGPFGLPAGVGAGAIGGGILAQEIEEAGGLRQEFSPGVLTADVALAYAPAARIARGLGMARRLFEAGRKGAQYGLAARTIERMVEERELPKPLEAIEAAGVGAVAGVGLETGARAVRGIARGVRALRKSPAVAATDEALGTAEIIPPPEPPPKIHEQPRIIRPGAEAPEGEVRILDASGRPVGEETPAGFIVPADTPPITTRPMPPERIPELVESIGGTAQRKAELRGQLERIAPELEAHRLAVIPDGEVERLSLGMRVPATLKPGQALNAEETATVYKALMASEAQLDSVREAVRGAPDDPAMQAAWQQALDDNLRLVKLFAGGRSEWGRTGRQLGIARAGPAGRVTPTLAERKVELTKVLRQAERKRLLVEGATSDEILKRVVANIDDPVAVVRIVRDSTRMPKKELLTNIVFTNYLSRTSTQERNIIGNTSEFGALTLGKAVAVAMGEPGVYVGELGRPLAVGFRTGLARGMRKGLEIFRDGIMREDLEDPDFLFRFLSGESPTELAAGLRGISLPGDSIGRRLGVGAARAVPRTLYAVDIFFRSIAQEIAKHQGAFARAHRQALEGGARNLRQRRLDIASEILADLPDDLVAESTLAGRRAVYQERPGFFAKGLMELGKRGIGWRILQLLLAPFLRTPANIMRRGITQKMPGISSIAMPLEARRQIKAAGLETTGLAADRIRAQLAGEMGLGYLAVIPLVYLAASGRLVGEYPGQEAERARFFERGGAPNSVIIGNRAVPLATFGGAGLTAQMVAAAVEQFDRDRDEVGFLDRIWSATAAAVTSIRDVSFMTGVREIFDTGVGDFSPKRFSRVAGRKISGLLVPGIAQQVEQIVEPTIRVPSAKTPPLRAGFEEFLSRIPGFSTAAPPRIGTFGEIREPVEDTIGQRVFSVLTGTRMIAPDPVRQELDRLQSSVGRPGYPVGVSPPTESYLFDGEPLEDVESLLAYRQARGQARGAAITWVMSQRGYGLSSTSDEQRAAALRKMTARADRIMRKRALPLVRAQRAGIRGSLTVEELLGRR